MEKNIQKNEEELVVDVQEQKIEQLLDIFDEHRKAIKNMIIDLEKIRTRVDTLLPDQLDARFMRFFEEKVKAITGLFNSLLDMRKEIAKSTKDEIEIRRRIKTNENPTDFEDILDIRSITRKIDEFRLEKERLQEERLKKNLEQKLEDGIDIPGVTSHLEAKP